MSGGRAIRTIGAAGALVLLTAAQVAAQAEPATAEAVASAPKDASFFVWMYKASGPIGLLILVLSFYLVALVAWMFLKLRKEVAIPPELVRQVSDLLAAKSYTEAYQRASTSRSSFGRVLTAGVRRLGGGLPAGQRALELALEDETMQMEHRTTYLATVGTLGPMIGLVGTVWGMILSFRVIAIAGAQPNAADLAAGISTALFATLEGIAVSIPAIYFYAVFRNRIARISLEIERACEGLLEQFAVGMRTPHPLAASANAPSAPPAPAGRRALSAPDGE